MIEEIPQKLERDSYIYRVALDYELIKNIYSYNINYSIRIKDKNLKGLLMSISMLNFYINISHDKKVISEKKYIIIGNFLSEIIAMTKALRKKEVTINE